VTQNWKHVYVSDKVANFNFLATGGQNGAGTHFPLYLYSADGKSRTANIDSAIKKELESIVGSRLSPEEVFEYVYGVLHSNKYRKKYMEFLKVDFPKIPYPKDRQSFMHYQKYGKLLRDLHLFKNIPRILEYASFSYCEENLVDRIKYEDECVYINKSQFFENIPDFIWNAQIGDDQPAKRWLNERKGCFLHTEEINYYRRLIYVLSETVRLMEKIDEDK